MQKPAVSQLLANLPSAALAEVSERLVSGPGVRIERIVSIGQACTGLPWQVLAAIGAIESQHAGGRADPSTGAVDPPILGPALDGTNGTIALRDPSSPDGWAHAQGPMQFLPATWQRWGRLAPRRPAGTVPSPHNAWDAIHSAAAYLCAGQPQLTDLRQAILSYNRSDEYVWAVMSKALEYGLGGIVAGGLACPVAGPVRFSDDFGDPRSGGRTHQGNDLVARYGEALVAIEAGVVTHTSDTDQGLGGITLWLTGDSGTRWYYAHNAVNLVAAGTHVTAGQPIARLGNTGNARDSIPHLHFEMHPSGGDPVNPYSVLMEICRR